MIDYKLTHPDARMPERATSGSAGYDIFTVEDVVFDFRSPYGTIFKLVKTGVKLDMTQNHFQYANLVARSSTFKNYGVTIPSTGIIDNDYQGEILIPLLATRDMFIPKGTALAQLIFQEYIAPRLHEVKEFICETERGSNGFGSTDEIEKEIWDYAIFK